MSGHSKWANIKHKKQAADAKRGKIFSKLAKEITIVVKASGGDPDTNPSLRTLLQKARSCNMPADNIERAIKKGTGELAGAALEEMIYEGYVAGVSVIVQVLTDNRNRSAAEVRHVFTRMNANMAQQGAVMRTFKRKGQIIFDAAKVSEDKVMEVALEAGAEDMQRDGDEIVVTTEPNAYPAVNEALQKAGLATDSSEVTMVPDLYVTIDNKAQANEVMKFVEGLEELEDVQNVYTNMDVADAVLKELGGE